MTHAELVRMNACECGALPGEQCCGRTFSRRIDRHHPARVQMARMVAAAARRYVDHLTTSYGPLVSSPSCEHCDGERSRWVRQDELRGWVCPPCDWSLDEMLDETATPLLPRRQIESNP